MTASVEHGSFTIERTYPATPQRVFAAWSRREQKNPWFGEGDDFLASVERYSLDFRLGGHEVLKGMASRNRTFVNDATFHDIVQDERIIVSYEVLVDGRRISVSVMTVELAPVQEGTHLVVTEQGAFLDGLDTNAQRVLGATDSLDQLGTYLERAQAA
jgi:uncharacterized protein YndB with AHSA1/START domain